MIKTGKIILTITLFLMAMPVLGWASTGEMETDTTDVEKAQVMKTYGKLPLYFIENDGQIDKKVRYYERGSGHSSFFTKDGVSISLTRSTKKQEEEKNTESPKDRTALLD